MMDSDSDESTGGKLTGEEIVVSGISGYFPQCENVQKLTDNLYDKVDMVENDEYENINHPQLPHYKGKITNLNKFDSQFFRFTYWQASSFDTMSRKTVELAYSAIFDAGINPESLKETKLGVFIGSSHSDTGTLSMYNVFRSNGFVISGCAKSMIANRISYWINAKGPSYNLDYACASSIACLEIAFERMKAGECDAAIVGSCNHIVHPAVSVNMKRLGFLCLDGKTKCFDKNGDGYVRSDAINLMFLQKAKHAKRIYTQIYHIKGKYFCDPDAKFLPSRSSKEIEKFFKEFYSEIDVSPNDVEYIEANATGIANADETELTAIGNVFGKTKPVKVGSIKSNIGHTESASGICSLTKVCLSYQRGEIPANLHYNEPQNIAPIEEGKVQVVTENTKFNRGFTAINNFSFTGANYHVLLKCHYKQKDKKKYKSNIPHLVLASGKLDTSVYKILSTLENNPIDSEEIALLNNVFKYNTPGHTGRGYTIIDTDNLNKTTCLARGYELYDGSTRPIWFLYSGMGSQWPTMGAQLMRLPIFAATIERCNEVLQPKGVNVIKIITDDDQDIFETITNSFIGITAVQIALTEVLRALNIAPDNIIGHSGGEIGCAYADGSLTLQEAMLLSYLRGVVSLETKMVKGKMAAIGLGHKEIRKLCPPEIDIACQNSSESTTISGPAEVVEKFVAYLKEQSIFAKTVASSDIAYHSRYVTKVGQSLLPKMKEIIKIPKARSKSWLSTSFSPNQWSEETSLYSSAEYFMHNVLNTVCFDEAAKFIPSDAIVIEIAPHGLMQAIMKRSHKSCMNLSLTRRGEQNSVKLLLQSIGTLYQAGLNPTIDALYPKMDFPVSTETPLLSHLVELDHSVDWPVAHFNAKKKIKTVSYEYSMSLDEDDYSFHQGCIRNGIITFPESGILVIVWKTLAMYNGVNYKETSVEFTKVNFHNGVKIKAKEILKLLVDIQKGTNFFQVTQKQKIIASGFISLELSPKDKLECTEFIKSDYHLNEKDIYRLMTIKGYDYEGEFKSIKHANIERTNGLIKWNNNWITFLDALFQLNALSRNHNGVSNLKLITRLVIDVEAHREAKKSHGLDKDVCYGVQVNHVNAVTKCSGVLLSSVIMKDIPKEEEMTEKLQVKKNFPHNFPFTVDLQTALQIILQIISESIKNKIIIFYKEVEYFSNVPTIVQNIAESVPSVIVDTQSVSAFCSTTFKAKPDVLLLYNLNKYELDKISNDTDTQFVVNVSYKQELLMYKNYNAITKFKIGNQIMVLFKKINSIDVAEKPGGYYYVPVEVKSKLNNVKLINGVFNGSTVYKWAEVPSVANNETIQVVYNGIDVNDTEKSEDLCKILNKNGVSFCGINQRGEKIMGITSDVSTSRTKESYDLLWSVPKHWTFEEAATVPLPYIQAYYCLRIRENLVARSNVLVTKGDSALGLATISLCLYFDCGVYATVSSIEKKKFLLKVFRNLEENHIGVNNLSFRQLVINSTKNHGCDIVINCEKGPNRQEAMKFVGRDGIFLDVCDHDMEENCDYGMAFNWNAKTYKSVRLSNLLFSPEYSHERKKLQLLLSEGIANGSVRPLPRVIYSPDDISKALKLLTTDNKIGSVLINMKDPAILNKYYKTVHRINLSSSKCNIVVCDGSELGVELIEHLIQRGAKKFLLHMKPKLMNGYFHVKYASWKNTDVVIHFNSDDLYTKSACDALIAQGEKLGGVNGIFITQDKLVDTSVKIDVDNVDISLITSNLDMATRNCTLNYFAVILFTPQALDELAFLEMENCCFTRCEIGLPSLILRYESQHKKCLPQALSKLYNAMETSLKHNYTSVFIADSKTKTRLYSDTVDNSAKDGLGAFFNKLSDEEILGSESLISMKTQVNYKIENELDLDPNETFVLMIPGLDGNYQTMISIAERLKIRAVTLQLEPDLVTSIPDIGKRLLSIVKTRINIKQKFYILGYSFGVNVALELAALLEKEGRTGIVFCLDSSPDAFKTQVISYTGDMSDRQLQNSVIEHFYNLVTGEVFGELKEDSAQTLEWTEKLNMFIDKVKGSTSHTNQFLKSLVNVAYRRIVMAKDYEPDFNLESEIVLMKGVPHPNSDELSDDYGLSKYSNKPVKVFDLEADHATAPQDIRVCNIINKMLDPELLEDFENKNLCKYYYL